MPSPRAANRHQILRQVLELDFGPGVQGPQLQDAVARSFRERALPELERLFDDMAGPEVFIRLDRLEVDLGELGGAEWDSEFRRRLVDQLAKRLAQCRSDWETEVKRGGRNQDAASLGEGPFPQRARVPEPRGEGGQQPPQEGWETIALRQWLFFLAHGRLPWWGGRPQAGWPEVLLPNLDQAIWRELLGLVRTNIHARLRLIDGLSDACLSRVVETRTGLSDLHGLIDWLTPARMDSAAAHRWRRDVWTILLDWAAGHGPPRETTVLIERLLDHREVIAEPLPIQDASTSESIRDPDPMAVARSWVISLNHPWRAWLEAALATRLVARKASGRASGLSGWPSPTALPPSDADGIPRHGVDESVPRFESSSPTTPMRPRPGPSDRVGWEAGSRQSLLNPDEAAAIYLEGAGAVIPHPFLEELFRDRGLLDKRIFRDEAARHRAVRLLALLIFGQDGVAEYDLPLAKLLCGLPFEAYLEPAELDDSDRAACDNLLRAVLGHWSALRSGSPDWLRQQFFLREGKLEPVDFGWRLTVERRAQDVLLARLPWGLGVIRLPWMEGQLHVRWLD